MGGGWFDPTAGPVDRPDFQRIGSDAQIDFAPPLGERLLLPAGQRICSEPRCFTVALATGPEPMAPQ